MVDHVAALTLAQVRVLQKDAQAICSVSQDDQREQEVRNSLCRLPLEISVYLWTSGTEVED